VGVNTRTIVVVGLICAAFGILMFFCRQLTIAIITANPVETFQYLFGTFVLTMCFSLFIAAVLNKTGDD